MHQAGLGLLAGAATFVVGVEGVADLGVGDQRALRHRHQRGGQFRLPDLRPLEHDLHHALDLEGVVEPLSIELGAQSEHPVRVGPSASSAAWWYLLNEARISRESFTESTTQVVSLPGWQRLSRDRVCTAWIPPRHLSTYMTESSGSSMSVWNLLVSSTWWWSPLKSLRRS